REPAPRPRADAAILRRAGPGDHLPLPAEAVLDRAADHHGAGIRLADRQRLRRRAGVLVGRLRLLRAQRHPAEGPERGDGRGAVVGPVLHRRQHRHRHHPAHHRSAPAAEGGALMAAEATHELEALTPRYMAWYRFTRNPTAI